MQSSQVGCQAFDSQLTNLTTSDSSENTYVPGGSDFAASLLAPAPVAQTVVTPQPPVVQSNVANPNTIMQNAVSPYYPVAAPPSTQSLSSLAYSASPTIYSGPSSSTLAAEFAAGQISLAMLFMPTQYLVSQGLMVAPSSGSNPNNLFNSVDPDVVAPETGSIAMIGSGLIFLSLASMLSVKRKRQKG
jgi:LPXTG-motif cell wall-anchored protein